MSRNDPSPTPPHKGEELSGGCQCGAVRYRVAGPLSNPHICHCRMCQKAAGNYFMPLANARKADFEVTRGAISWFFSSAPVRRGFCKDCGTPLIVDTVGGPDFDIMLGSLDNPAALAPIRQIGTEAKMPWFGALDALPGEATEDSEAQDGVWLSEIRATNRQHPDHDTETWPRKA